MGKILLVHGAWHGGWCWEEVAPALSAKGHEVVTTELHRGSVSGDVAAAQADVDALGEGVVVCGHSYGGVVISGLRADGIAHAVYLAALMPDADESAMGLAALGPATELGEAIEMGEDGFCTVKADRLVEVFYADCDPSQQERAIARLRPQAVATLGESPGRALWRQVDSTYVRCEEDRAVHPELQAELAKRAKTRVDWPTSHSPFFSAPDRLVDLLSALAS